MTTRILLADDDRELCALLQRYLEAEDMDVRLAHDGPTALEAARRADIDAVVLDIMMPGMDGIEVLRQLRPISAVPVLMLTARGEDVDRIVGLELGADDYLPKPCNPRELLARIRAILRRCGPAGADQDIAVGDIELLPGRRELRLAGERVALTSTEFSVAHALLREAGSVVDKAALYRAALGRDPGPYDRSIDMHVSNLRRKLGPLPDGSPRIETVRGHGYQYRV